MQPITRLKVVNKPNIGELVITAVGGKRSKTFVHQYAIAGANLEDDASCTNVTCTTRKCRISNLKKNMEYVVRVMGIGAKGQNVISNIEIRIVQ